MINHKLFEYFMSFIILLNCVTLAIETDDTSKFILKIIKFSNITFNIIYILECILKIYAFGWVNYFFINWNRLDFFVAFTGLVETILENVLYDEYGISDDH